MAQQTIYLGATPNAGTGTTLRDGGDMINDNFTELYDAMTKGPCNGSKYSALRIGIVNVTLTPLIDGNFYYMKELKVATGSAGAYVYSGKIYKSDSISTAGTQVGYFSITGVVALKTGKEAVSIGSFVTPGGVTGTIVFDWDMFATGTTYTCASWSEGGFFTINTPVSNPGGTGGGAIYEITTTPGAAIDGSSPIIVVNSTSDITATVVVAANADGSFTVKNENTGSVDISSATTEKLDGYDIIRIAQHEWATFIPNNGRYTVYGIYLGVNTP